VGSFNYDNTQMHYKTYYLPVTTDTADSILDYNLKIAALEPHERFYMPEETGNYSVAGFRIELKRKVAHYIITYYIPSGEYTYMEREISQTLCAWESC